MALVLVIDDSSFMRGKICSILAEGGHESIEAEDGLKGFQVISARHPDLVLLDIIMPGMDGLKLLHTKREMDLSLPMIVITADIQESTRKQCLELGAFTVLNKPPKKEELLNAVRDALG